MRLDKKKIKLFTISWDKLTMPWFRLLTKDTNFRKTYIVGLYVNTGEGTVKIRRMF